MECRNLLFETVQFAQKSVKIMNIVAKGDIARFLIDIRKQFVSVKGRTKQNVFYTIEYSVLSLLNGETLFLDKNNIDLNSCSVTNSNITVFFWE